MRARFFTKICSGFLILLLSPGVAQEPYRMGTTGASFLEIGYGSAGISMGDAYVTMARDLSAVYWNPAGLGFLRQNEMQLMIQPWLADIDMALVGVAVVYPRMGSFAFSVLSVSYGGEPVTTVTNQEGTGEFFDGQDYSINFSFARRFVDWFSFGLTGKYIISSIYDMKASAIAMDMGAIVHTEFFNSTGKVEDGLTIGMSISNYGNRMQYDGIRLNNMHDMAPDEYGNYQYSLSRYELVHWELPLIFRLGLAVHPVNTLHHRITAAVDALHPNNNSEYVNVGGQYQLYVPGTGRFSLRAGYKGLFMVDSEYGMTFGAGMELHRVGNNALILDYAYRDIGLLGGTHAYTIRMVF